MPTEAITNNAADEYLAYLGERRGLPGRHALLACAFALALDDTLAAGLIRAMTGTDVIGGDVLARSVKGLDCVTIDPDTRDWYIDAGVRLVLMARAKDELLPRSHTRLREHVAEYAERLAGRMKPVGVKDFARLRGLRFEAAYQRLFLATRGTRGRAARVLVDLYERADQAGRRAVGYNLEFLAPEMELLLGVVPEEFAPLREAALERERRPEPGELALGPEGDELAVYLRGGGEPREGSTKFVTMDLHLSRRAGERPDPHGGPVPLSYRVTRCGTALPGDAAQSLETPSLLDHFKPCADCGTPADFAAAAGRAAAGEEPEDEAGDGRPKGKFVCRACHTTWDGGQLIRSPRHKEPTWLCGDAFCGAMVDPAR